jgi:hypothetical protein
VIVAYPSRAFTATFVTRVSCLADVMTEAQTRTNKDRSAVAILMRGIVCRTQKNAIAARLQERAENDPFC